MIAEDLVAHVMRRVGFGVRQDELTTLAALPTYESLVDLVTAAPAATTELVDYAAATVDYFGIEEVEYPVMNRMAFGTLPDTNAQIFHQRIPIATGTAGLAARIHRWYFADRPSG